MRKLLFVLFSLLCCSAFAADYYPPDERFGQYEPNVIQGIVGGIPSRSGGTIVYAADYGFSDAASAATNKAAIDSAEAAVSSGGIIMLPAGTFDCDNFLFDNYLKSNFTLRGAGAGQTILQLRGGQYGIKIGTSTDTSVGPPTSTITTMTKDSTSVVLSDGSSFPSPSTENTYRLGRIFLANEAATPVFSVNGNAAVRKPTVLLVSRSGNTVTLAQPLPSSFSDGASGAYLKLSSQNNNTVYGIGIEDMTLDGSEATGNDIETPVWIENSFNCWIKNVTITGQGRYGIQVSDAHAIEITGVYMVDGVTGVLLQNTTNALIYDNVILGQSSGYALEAEQGVMGLIWAYNYHGESNIINTNHGPQNSFMLLEGNMAGLAQSDGFFGGSSEETHFRNWWTSGNIGSFKRLTRYVYPTANIVGMPSGTYSNDGSDDWGAPNIANTDFNGGTWQLSAADYSVDWDSGSGVPKSWTGTLTTRSTDYTGIITLGTGQVTDFTTAFDNHRDGDPYRIIELPNGGKPEISISLISGDDLTFSETGNANVLPDQDSAITIWPGASGFQEKDLDVNATITRKANYYFWTTDIPLSEALGADTLPASYAWTTKPSWFGNLAWPAYDSSAPMASDAAGKVAIPAGYRYINGNSNYLGATGGISISGTLTVTGTITLE